MHGMQEKVPSLRQSNLQLVFLRTISLKGAMSRYCRVFPENVKLITSLKLELEKNITNEMILRKKQPLSRRSVIILKNVHGFVFFQDYPNVIRFNLVHLCPFMILLQYFFYVVQQF